MYVNTSAVDRLAVKLASDEKNQPTQYVGHFFGYVPILNPVQGNRNSTKVGSIETLFTPARSQQHDPQRGHNQPDGHTAQQQALQPFQMIHGGVQGSGAGVMIFFLCHIGHGQQQRG